MNNEVKLRQLVQAYRRNEKTVIVHYACESFYDVTDRPVAVSCVGLLELGESNATTYSITDYRSTDDGGDDDKAEIRTLERVYAWLRERSDAIVVHWNMSSSEFGFPALGLRYTFLTGKDHPPYVVPEDKLYDLDDMIAEKHGEGYADHPRLRSIAAMNGCSLRHFLRGAEEAEAYKQSEHGKLKRSVGEKVRVIADLLERLATGELQSKLSGPSVRFAGEMLDSVQVVLDLGQRFRYVERQIRRRHGDRPTIKVGDEYDAQDLLHSLLRIFFDDVRAEEYSPSYAGGSSRIDFVLPQFEIAVELKHARNSMTSKSLGEELMIDIARYGGRSDVRHLICLVFDHDGQLQNPRGVERDLSRTDSDAGVTITVAIMDR